MKVSVIIPCYNCETYINETIQSVLAQDTNDVEIICIDNGSTDNTLNLLKELQENVPNLIIDTEKQAGASYARTKGISIARGKYIQFLDSDDIILPGKFSAQINHIEKHHLDWVISDRSIVNENLDIVLSEHTYAHFMESPLAVAISEVITSGNPLYTRDIVTKVGGYTPQLKVAQDWDFHIKLILNNSRFGYIKGDYFHSRTVENSLSSNWFFVSTTLCELILRYKKDFTDHDMLINPTALKKIHNVHLSSIILSRNSVLSKKLYKELKFWSQEISIKRTLIGKNKIAFSVLGLKAYTYLKRLFSKKLD